MRREGRSRWMRPEIPDGTSSSAGALVVYPKTRVDGFVSGQFFTAVKLFGKYLFTNNTVLVAKQ